ncbi:leucine-rich repeat receptor-like protein FASCIATED EAR2 [Miscanthus floridulus]|uniref:leucine-rich repeat receptor-like protein FASCIATED EAR2 n=1 Tax=Miscanthus floridulus TaxID=154761 RepID=UPI0034590C0E
MRSLVNLDVSGNALSGLLLGAPGTLPPSLWSVAARKNSFSVPLSTAALAALPAVRVLDLTGNTVSDAVSGAALAHPALQQLRLGSNQLDAVQEAPDGGSSSQLVELDLSGNRLAGRLPACLGAMPRPTVGLLSCPCGSGGSTCLHARMATAAAVPTRVPAVYLTKCIGIGLLDSA